MQFALCDAFHKIIHNRKPLNILCASPANYNSKNNNNNNNNKKGCKENDLTTVGFEFGLALGHLKTGFESCMQLLCPAAYGAGE